MLIPGFYCILSNRSSPIWTFAAIELCYWKRPNQYRFRWCTLWSHSLIQVTWWPDHSSQSFSLKRYYKQRNSVHTICKLLRNPCLENENYNKSLLLNCSWSYGIIRKWVLDYYVNIFIIAGDTFKISCTVYWILERQIWSNENFTN